MILKNFHHFLFCVYISGHIFAQDAIKKLIFSRSFSSLKMGQESRKRRRHFKKQTKKQSGCTSIIYRENHDEWFTESLLLIIAKRKGMDAKWLKPVGCQDAGKRPDCDAVFKMAASEIVRLNNLKFFFSQMIRYYLESLNALSCWVILIYWLGS